MAYCIPALLVSTCFVLNPVPQPAAGDSRRLDSDGAESTVRELTRFRWCRLRQKLRDLRLEASFVERRLAEIPRAQRFELRRLDIAGAPPAVSKRCCYHFHRRYDRLEERLRRLQAQITASRRRLNLPGVPATQPTTGTCPGREAPR